jgi:sarcosine oxidase, subunit beta
MPEERLFDLRPQEVVNTEIAVIGGGIVGLATAYYLAKRGRRVVVLEKSSFGFEASGRTAAGVRQQGRDIRELPLARASVALWADLDEELQGQTHYRRTGNIFIAVSTDEVARFQVAAEKERAGGLHVEMLDRDRLKRMVPSLSDRCVGGKYCPTDGMAEPWAVINALVAAIARLGGQLYPNTEALDFVVQDDRVVSVLTDTIEFRPEVTVNAAGPWATLLASRVGINLPIRPFPAQLIETERVELQFDGFLVFPGEAVYCRPTVSGRIHFGPITVLTQSDVTRNPSQLSPIVQVHKKIASLVPMLASVHISRAWTGLLDVTPDTLPIIGPVPGLRNFIVAAGFSGHGFGLAPGVGLALSTLIADGSPSVPLHPFSLSRFATTQ